MSLLSMIFHGLLCMIYSAPLVVFYAYVTFKKRIKNGAIVGNKPYFIAVIIPMKALMLLLLIVLTYIPVYIGYSFISECSIKHDEGFCDHLKTHLSGCYVLSIQNGYSEIQNACDQVCYLKSLVTRQKAKPATPVVYSLKTINVGSSSVFGEHYVDELAGGPSEYFLLDVIHDNVTYFKDNSTFNTALGLDNSEHAPELLTPDQYIEISWSKDGRNYWLILYLFACFAVEVVIVDVIMNRIAIRVIQTRKEAPANLIML